MDTTKAYIDARKDSVGLNCPDCQRVTEVSITALGFKHHLKVKCTCQNIFLVAVEFRDRFRRRLDAPGFYEIVAQPRARAIAPPGIHWQPIPVGQEKTNCRIIDLSWAGVGFIVPDEHKLKIGDFVNLRFRLGNNAGTMIDQTCRVKHVDGNFVGGKMLQET
jgi:hypothetical protein